MKNLKNKLLLKGLMLSQGGLGGIGGGPQDGSKKKFSLVERLRRQKSGNMAQPQGMIGKALAEIDELKKVGEEI